MKDFGAKEQAEASNLKPEQIRGLQPKQKQSADESEKHPEAEAEALNKPKMIRGSQPKQSPDESKQQLEASSSKQEKRGRKPKLTEYERHENKKQNCRKYRQRKAENNRELEQDNKRLKEENEELKKEKAAQQSEINSLKKKLTEFNARADKLVREVNNESKKVNMVKIANEALEPGMQQLQQNFLNQDDQDQRVVNSESNNISIDYDQLNNLIMEDLIDFTGYPDPTWSNTTGCCEGTSIAKAKLSPLPEIVNVNGFCVLKDNSAMIQEIFSEYPNIASGLQVHHPASRNGFMNTLAEVYKMATIELEKCTLAKIKLMEEGIEDMELAGLEIPWLKDLVTECRTEVVEKEEIRSLKAKLKLLEESRTKRSEERESKRQRAI